MISNKDLRAPYKNKTLIIGATTNPVRYAYLAAHRLTEAGHKIINIGIRKGEVAGEPIQSLGAVFSDVDTITLYIGPSLQNQYYDYILQTKPRRLIFNPGTENDELAQLVLLVGIEPLTACTLVLLATHQY